MQCSYVAPDGTQCQSTVGLELDHKKPFARGGIHSNENLHVLCRVHNWLAAEKVFGKSFMQQFVKRKSSAPEFPNQVSAYTKSV